MTRKQTEERLRLLIVSCSLNEDSKSRRMGTIARQFLTAREAEVDWVDLRDHDLPLCRDKTTKLHPEAQALRKRIAAADGVLLCAPVYNYGLNAAAKNLTELTGLAWKQQVVAMAIAAGGQRSGMAPMALANSMMLDFRCIIVPRFAYLSRGDFDADGQPDEGSMERLGLLCDELYRIAAALRQPSS